MKAVGYKHPLPIENPDSLLDLELSGEINRHYRLAILPATKQYPNPFECESSDYNEVWLVRLYVCPNFRIKRDSPKPL